MTDTSFYINKFPVYAAVYVSKDEILLAGGGGPSKSGYKNRIATYSIPRSLASAKNAKERTGICTGEAVLADDEDAPSSLAIHEDLVLSGVNESAALRKKSGDNHHLRSFRLELSAQEKNIVKVKLEYQIFDDLDVALDDYQKVTKISRDGKYAGLVSAEGKGAIVDMSTMTRIKALEAVDIEFGDQIWVATQTKISILPYALDEAKTVFDVKQVGVISKHKISQIRLISPTSILVSLNSAGSAFIGMYDLYKGLLVQKHIIYSSSRITNLYLSPDRHVAAVTTSDSRLSLYRTTNMSHLQSWKKLHAFPISTVAFSPDTKELVTGSIDEKINVIDLEAVGTRSLLHRSVLTLLMMVLLYLIFLVVSGRLGILQRITGPGISKQLDDLAEQSNQIFEQRAFQEL